MPCKTPRILRSQKNVLILLAGRAVLADAPRCWRIAHRHWRGADGGLCGGARAVRGWLPLPRVPYNTDMAVQTLSRFEHIILVGAKAAGGFFRLSGKPQKQYPPAGQSVRARARGEQDSEAALRAWQTRTGRPQWVALPDAGPRPQR